MPSFSIPYILMWELYWDWITNMLSSPVIYYPVTTFLKDYIYWSEHVFVGILSYVYALIDCLAVTAFHAMHGSLAFASHYTIRIGESLKEDEFEQLLRAAWAMLTWFAYPVRKDLTIWCIDYDPYKTELNEFWTLIRTNKRVFELVGFGPIVGSVQKSESEEEKNVLINGYIKRIEIGNTAATQSFRIRIENLKNIELKDSVEPIEDNEQTPEGTFGTCVLLDGYPDTRCAYWTYPFWSSTFSYHAPTCWALGKHFLDGLQKGVIEEVEDCVKKWLEKLGIPIDKMEKEDKKRQSTDRDYTFVDRLCCAYKDETHFGGMFDDNPIYYAWTAAKTPPFTSHAISTMIMDFSKAIADTVVITGETIDELIESWKKH